ncbi:MAG: DegT/DnrJ/EryC1/StrS family aminotransferase [Phycisphaeraceae bacterium]
MRTKTCIQDLAILGGPPAFDQPLHVGRPNIGDRARLMQRLNDILDRAWLSNHGTCVQEFERRLKELLGVRHCLVVCNATVGLEIALRALDMHGEVIVPAFTAAATAHAVNWLGMTPVFCDIDAQTHNLDPACVESLITPRTSGILAVHLWGRSCAVEALADIAQRHRLKLLFDAAHALLCSHRGQYLGGFGHAEVFSFHATKFCNSLEGGAIATNDDALAQRITLMRTFGFSGPDVVLSAGINGKLNEFAAAMGLTSLESADQFIAVNRRHWQCAVASLADLPGVSMISYDTAERNNYHYLVLQVDAAQAGINRDALLAVLTAENVLARRHFYPGCHRWEPYVTADPQAYRRLPNTEKVAAQVLQLPNGTGIPPDAIQDICAVIRLAAANGGELMGRLGGDGRNPRVNPR